jgi:putative pyruvate formate lyase activating enzyme
LEGLAAFKGLWIWDHLADRLGWYYRVALNEKPAKYLIAKRTPLPLKSYQEAGTVEEALEVYRKATDEFLKIRKAIEGGEPLEGFETPTYSLLDLAHDLVQALLKRCIFCRWRCRVDRERGEKLGACMLTAESRVSTYFHHLGEELVFRGVLGSGTIFFTSCNMRCLFCQNSDISKDRFNGEPATPRELAQMAYLLRLEGCHNVNWVGGEPTIHLHAIITAIWHLGREGFRLHPSARELQRILEVKADYYPFTPHRGYAQYGEELNVPILFNTNMYMTPETLTLLRPLVDVWLPDFKFGPDKCAVRLARTPWYYETVTRNLATINEWGEDILIRHLIMPNHVECCTRPVLEWIAKHTPDLPVNVMDQYRPEAYANPHSPEFDERARDIARHPTREELLQAWRIAEELKVRYREVTFEKRSYRPLFLPRGA